MRPRPEALLALCLSGVALSSATAAPRIDHIQPLQLHSGVNMVPAMAPDGRDGLIVVGAPNVETADQTSTEYFILLRPAKPGDNWEVVRTVGLQLPDGSDDTRARDLLSEYPHTGEDQVSSLRFARARIDGSPAFVLIHARRDFVMPIPDPSRVTFDIYQLKIDPEFKEAQFVRIDRRRSTACYGNSDLALHAELGLPLPRDYEGPKAAGVCGSD